MLAKNKKMSVGEKIEKQFDKDFVNMKALIDNDVFQALKRRVVLFSLNAYYEGRKDGIDQLDAAINVVWEMGANKKMGKK